MSVSAAPGEDVGGLLGDPPKPPAPGGAITIPLDPPTPTTETQPTGKTFSEKDIERIRKEEKDKLYPQLQSLQDEVKKLTGAQAAEAKAKEDAKAAQEASARSAAEEEMSARELLEARELEWDQRMRSMEDEIARRDALIEAERHFSELVEYRRQAVDINAENIIPELRDLVTGSTFEEVDASVASLVERSTRILEQVGAAQQQARQQMRGTSVTAPPAAGPMDQDPGYQTYTADDIRNMDMATYAKNRNKLLQAGSAARRSGEGRGLFN